jgi:protein arginine kinase activator
MEVNIMLCDKCKEKPATVHIVKVVNGVKQEINICEDCAKIAQGFSMLGEISSDSPFTFQNVLGGLVDYINQSSNCPRNIESICPKCGMSYSEFKKNGLMGCDDCYKNFVQIVTPVIKRVQGNIEHVGKIPLKSGKVIMEKKLMESLKEQLQKSILEEEFEMAAQIRDKIRALQNNDKEV